MRDHLIFGIHVTDRVHHAVEVQSVLSDYGHIIKTRIGLHDVQGDRCTPGGLILLEIYGEGPPVDTLRETLTRIEGVEIQQMRFRH